MAVTSSAITTTRSPDFMTRSMPGVRIDGFVVAEADQRAAIEGAQRLAELHADHRVGLGGVDFAALEPQQFGERGAEPDCLVELHQDA